MLRRSLEVLVVSFLVWNLSHQRSLHERNASDEGLSKPREENEPYNETDDPLPELYGLNVEESSDKKRVSHGVRGNPVVLEALKVRIRIFGVFPKQMDLRLTKFDCADPNNNEPIYEVDVDKSGGMGSVKVLLPIKGEFENVFLCLRSRGGTWVKEGDIELKPWLVIRLYEGLLPLWIQIVLIVTLLLLSGLFSGLNLGLMSLNKTDLKIIINTGTSSEKSYASKIAPVRNHGNFLLCCILFSNVLVNVTLTIIMDELTSGFFAVILSTLFIVVFGEIIPQAICSRHGLAVGAKTIFITKFFMFITFPMAYPMSKLLDKLLGEEIGNVYTRERLKELLKVTKDYHGLENEEVDIISGALDMRTKCVKDVMTRIEHVYMIPIDAKLDYDTMSEVEFHGYSRIPVFEFNRNNIVALLNIKQLTLLDPSDEVALRTIVEYYKSNQKLFFVFENTRLDYMFRAFREGSQGHMAFVQKVNTDGPGDPYYETVGIVTMEDVLEELLQSDIMDETDIGKLQAKAENRNKATPYMKQRKYKPAVDISPPLALAAVQYLTTSVEPFKNENLSVNVLHRLIKTSVNFLKLPKRKMNMPPKQNYLYEFGKPAEYFTMILEGRVYVEVGKEKLTYEGGPFSCFGSNFLLADPNEQDSIALRRSLHRRASLKENLPTSEKTETKEKKKMIYFIPDYSVRAITDIFYLRMRHTTYRAGRLASSLERNARPSQPEALREEEIERMLNEAEDDDFFATHSMKSTTVTEATSGPMKALAEVEVTKRQSAVPSDTATEETRLLEGSEPTEK